MESFLCCPCEKKKKLKFDYKKNIINCTDSSCNYSIKKKNTFSFFNKKPLLINFEKNNLFKKSNFKKKKYFVKRINNNFLKKLLNFIFGTKRTSKKNFEFIFRSKKKLNVLIIGSGTLGSGIESFYNKHNFFGIDIYDSLYVDLICDAHNLPIKSNIFDVVVIQAVLEHVLEPKKVVNEIYRVLKVNGLVYAETPFMQQVHEGKYDFTRWTLNGHNFLFKDFKLLKFGAIGGPFLSLAWSLKYALWSIFRNKILSTIIALPFYIISKFIDNFCDERSSWDSSCGNYLIAVKKNKKQSYNISFYNGFQK
jgi:ubiquinone/menaquinone biosynthesis C-methylase UbiE